MWRCRARLRNCAVLLHFYPGSAVDLVSNKLLCKCDSVQIVVMSQALFESQKLGKGEKVYIFDKLEANAAQVGDEPSHYYSSCLKQSFGSSQIIMHDF